MNCANLVFNNSILKYNPGTVIKRRSRVVDAVTVAILVASLFSSTPFLFLRSDAMLSHQSASEDRYNIVDTHASWTHAFCNQFNNNSANLM
jgi:hypothetical protein